MPQVPKLEADLGMEVYGSKSEGIGGRIRCFPEDFVVEEKLVDGSRASVHIRPEKILTSGHGRYLICNLVKNNWDTFLAIRTIARFLETDPEQISIAGIKDKRALTAQYVSIGGIPIERVLNIGLKGIDIKPVRFSSEEMSSKLLFGNHFKIMVRSIRCNSAIAEKKIEATRRELKNQGGFPNFFGHQRFGTIRPITHLVGRHIVMGDLEDAAMIFLSKQSLYEHPSSRESRKLLGEKRDFNYALKQFPRELAYERIMLKHLAKHPRDFTGAFCRLPRILCRLFVHAYQSFLFNVFLSERIKHGLSLEEIEAGDFVVKRGKNEPPKGKRESLALPIVGYCQNLSGGKQGEIEKEFLEKEGILPSDFFVAQLPIARAKGGLRLAAAQEIGFSSKIKKTSEVSSTDAEFYFGLRKGRYATVLLREFMKSPDLVDAGF